MEFSHVGLITDQPKPGEVFVEATRVWITDFVSHPFHVEWLRFEPDSPVTGPVRQQPTGVNIFSSTKLESRATLGNFF